MQLIESGRSYKKDLEKSFFFFCFTYSPVVVENRGEPSTPSGAGSLRAAWRSRGVRRGPGRSTSSTVSPTRHSSASTAIRHAASTPSATTTAPRRTFRVPGRVIAAASAAVGVAVADELGLLLLDVQAVSVEGDRVAWVLLQKPKTRK